VALVASLVVEQEAHLLLIARHLQFLAVAVQFVLFGLETYAHFHPLVLAYLNYFRSENESLY
jgi:hypothetical protein